MFEKLAATIIGSFLMGIGINGFLIPHHLLDGGIIGLGLILHYYFQLPTGLCMVLLSTPLFILAWFYEKSYFFYSLHGLLISSFLIDMVSFIQDQLLLSVLPSSMIGGMLVGIGIGVMLRYETSTGGTDLLAQLLTKRIHIHVGIIIFFIDALIIFSGLDVIGFDKFLYSFITIFCGAIMTSLTVTRKK
ncbi:YitT family protein [Bacillus sp. 03113]|uniref:YitT family protein n=1 Tax=Bacillus sp. 03113 TaxID=2578211 RepID=UPI0011429785|nr:YitT family protein [Bacillus sp. 03113]